MIDVAFSKTDLKRLDKVLSSLKPSSRAGAIAKGMTDAGLLVDGALKKNISGRILKVGTGHLRNSIGSRLRRLGKGIIVSIGSGVGTGKRLPYANIHETGGIIKPIRANFLKFKIGNVWRMVKQVKMPARHYLSRTSMENKRKVINEIIKSIIRRLRKEGAR